MAPGTVEKGIHGRISAAGGGTVSEKKDEREGKKFCPFLMMVPEFMNSDCEREKCAWWNADMQACSVAALGRMATYWMLNDSRDRMTPEERRGLRPEATQ